MEKVLMTTGPHGAHNVVLVQDDKRKPDNRIYGIKSNHSFEAVAILGSELQTLVDWWEKEKKRK